MNFNIDPKKINITNEIDKQPGIVYEPAINSPNLTNTSELLDNIITVLEYMNTEEMINLKIKDETKYKDIMEKKFYKFSDKYYATFQKLLSGEDITQLFDMIAMLERVKKGNINFESAEKKIGEQLAQKYIYPNFDKKKKRKK